MVAMTTSPGGVDAGSVGGRWTPARCGTNRRIIDVNPIDDQVRFWCERCRAHHIYDLGHAGRAAGFIEG